MGDRGGRGGHGRSWRKRRGWEIVEEEEVMGDRGGRRGDGRSWRKRRGWEIAEEIGSRRSWRKEGIGDRG